MMIFLLLNGLIYPRFTAACGLIYALMHLVKGVGYGVYGPKGRMVGGIGSHFGDIPL